VAGQPRDSLEIWSEAGKTARVTDREPGPRLRLPRRATLVSAAAATGAVLLFPVTFKVIKCLGTGDGRPPFGDVALVLLPDLACAFAVAAVLLGLVRLGWNRPHAAGPIWGTSVLVTLVIVGLSTVEHQSWERTASLLDWKILWYTIRHFAELQVVIAAETTLGGISLLVCAALFVLLPWLLDMLWSEHPHRDIRPSWRAVVLSAVPVLPLVLGAHLATPTAAELQPLASSAAVAIFTDAFSSAKAAASTGVVVKPIDVGAVKRQIEQRIEQSQLALTPTETSPKNVLVFVLESTRWDATTLYTPQLRTTPRLAQLGAQGVVAEHAYTDMPHTSKALVSILCGYAAQTSVDVSEAQLGGLPDPCLAHVLKKFGYRSAFFQAATGTFENRKQLVENAGFDELFARESYDSTGFEEINYLSIEDDVMVEPALRWLTKEPGKPFFGTILTCIQHHRYGLPNDFPVEELAPKRPHGRWQRTPYPPDHFNRYLNTIRYADRFVGKVLDGLAAKGLLDDTLVVVVGDHGQGFMEHGQKYHNTVIHDEGLRVPLLFYNARHFSTPQRAGGLRRQVDIAPTVLSALGVSYPGELFEGEDILASPGHDYSYSSCWYDERCMAEHHGNLKVIDFFDHEPMQVFDTARDPFERWNLLGRSFREERDKYLAIAAEARVRMAARRNALQQRYAREADGAPWQLDAEPAVATRVPVRLEDKIELLGYSAPTLDAKPGSFWEATVYFKCLAPSDPGWRLFGTLQTVDARTFQTDHHAANGRFTLDHCKPGSYIADPIRVWIPNDLPAGRADFLWGSVYLKDRGSVRKDNPRLARRRVYPLERGLAVEDDAVHLATLNVLPQYTPDLTERLAESVLKKAPKPGKPIGVEFGDGLFLEGVTFDPPEATNFGAIQITTTWRVEERTPGPWQIALHFVDAAGQYRRDLHSPVDGLHPVGNWEPGTWVQDHFGYQVPTNMAAGSTEVWAELRYERKRVAVKEAPGAVVQNKRVLLGTFKVLASDNAEEAGPSARGAVVKEIDDADETDDSVLPAQQLEE
jgi:lipoteichoic acid synthase